MKKLLIPALLLMCINVYGQSKVSDELAIKQTITTLFDGMRQSDTAKMSSTVTPKAILQTISKSASGKVSVRDESTAKFIASMAGTHPYYDEKLSFQSIKIDAELASAWTNYQFFIDGKFSHCGVNAFQLAKIDGSWKIIYIIDTKRKDNCLPVD